MLIGRKKIDAIILSEVISTSGKYKAFFAQHYRGDGSCYDVGTFNTETGKVIRRHYPSKVEALAFWEEFRTKITEEAQMEEKDEKAAFTIH